MTLESVPPLVIPQVAREAFYVAMVIDGTVHEIMNVNGQGAARLLSQPTFVQIGPFDAVVGSTFDGTTFSSPE